jgi:hypothetical protein
LKLSSIVLAATLAAPAPAQDFDTLPSFEEIIGVDVSVRVPTLGSSCIIHTATSTYRRPVLDCWEWLDWRFAFSTAPPSGEGGSGNGKRR